jgi:thioredoxin-like negative regulator of GroEL
MGEVDAALAAGPVVMELGATWCDWCQKEKPVLRSLAGQYPGVAFLYVDIDQSKAMKDAFYVSSVPQLEVIVKRMPTAATCTSTPPALRPRTGTSRGS